MPPQKRSSLDKLLDSTDIWRASDRANRSIGIPTGLRKLDEALHYGGWPTDGLTELLFDTPGIGELRLLAPSLARLSRQDGLLALVAPPYIPYAPGLMSYGIDTSRLLIIQVNSTTDLLWATEQAIASGACSGVLSWLPDTGIQDKNLRKLQLATHQRQSLNLLLRPSSASRQASPAALRIKINSNGPQLRLNILKQRGGWAGQQISLPIPKRLYKRQLSVAELPVYNSRALTHGQAPQGVRALPEHYASSYHGSGAIH